MQTEEQENELDQETEDSNAPEPTPDESEPSGEEESGKTGDEPAPDEGESGKEGDEPPEEGKSKKRLKRRIYQLSQERDRLRKEKEELERQVKKPDEELVEPDRDSFDSLEEYYEALSAYREKKAVANFKAEQERKQREEAEEREFQTLSEKWQESREEAADRYEDFDEVLATTEAPMTSTMSRYYMESEIGADVAYYMASHPEKADKIAKLSPILQVRELAKIEGTVSAEMERRTDKPVSSAPEPVTPVKGGESDEGKPSAKEPIDDWMAKRRKQVHGK